MSIRCATSTEPERVFQLLHPDLPADFPPIRTLATRPNNLPLQPTPFLGREEQVARVVDLLVVMTSGS